MQEYELDHSPNKTSLAPASSPSGPATVVSVWPHLGPGGVPARGKGLGIGAKGGPVCDRSASILADLTTLRRRRSCEDADNAYSYPAQLIVDMMPLLLDQLAVLLQH